MSRLKLKNLNDPFKKRIAGVEKYIAKTFNNKDQIAARTEYKSNKAWAKGVREGGIDFIMKGIAKWDKQHADYMKNRAKAKQIRRERKFQKHFVNKKSPKYIRSKRI